MGVRAKVAKAEERFFLYIDILNFSNLLNQKDKVKELYEIINSLNVHRHDVFTTIIFSDTILVYNREQSQQIEDIRYIVMFLCEFAQDLFYRLIGRDIYFRAYVTCGDFTHYAMENIKDVFYGGALIGKRPKFPSGMSLASRTTMPSWVMSREWGLGVGRAGGEQCRRSGGLQS